VGARRCGEQSEGPGRCREQDGGSLGQPRLAPLRRTRFAPTRLGRMQHSLLRRRHRNVTRPSPPKDNSRRAFGDTASPLPCRRRFDDRYLLADQLGYRCVFARPGAKRRWVDLELVANLKCLCRKHHLLKTFWPEWRDEQHPDGTIVWTSPTGQKYLTRPGSRLLFPALCLPTGELPTAPTGYRPSSDRGVMMPKRRRTRAQDRAHRIDAERALNADHIAERNQPPPF